MTTFKHVKYNYEIKVFNLKLKLKLNFNFKKTIKKSMKDHHTN